MTHNILKSDILKAALAGVLTLGMASCADDLKLSPIDPQSSQAYDDMSLLAKQYAVLGTTGQQGPAGKGDLSMDEGESGFYRTMFNLEELCTDECIWAWQHDDDIAPLTYIAWNKDSKRVSWTYSRLSYDITQFNNFLTANAEKTDGEWPHYLAEVRFLRALHYYYFLDLFRKAPFADTYQQGVMPEEKAGKDLYEWLDTELTTIEGQLAEIGSYNNSQNFGRADQGAAYALHARLALNSEVYTNGAIKDYQKAVDYCDLIIGSGKYELSKATNANGYTGYEQVFMGDNDQNPQAMKEIIFPIRQDGTRTQEYAGSTYLVSSMRIAGMPFCSTNNCWSCNFARHTLLKHFFNNPEKDMPHATDDEVTELLKAKYDGKGSTALTVDEVIDVDDELNITTADVIEKAKDDRAMFYTGVGGKIRSLSTKQITGFENGASIVKWQNRRSDNTEPSNENFSDTDIPLFRLAEIYLTRAEALYRLGTDDAQALADLNQLRSRAKATEATSIDLNILIDEWCKEFYMEGRRRSDLVRFGMFTGNKYLWDFKGGEADGTSVDKKFNVYPIPTTDLSLNPNMHQNDGY